MSARDRQAPSPPPSAEPTSPVGDGGSEFISDSPLRRGVHCAACLDTGWAFVAHSDEARERCVCNPAPVPLIAGPTETLNYHPQMRPIPFDVSLLWGGLSVLRH